MSSLDSWISENIPDVVLDDASTWLVRLDSDDCSPSDRLAFARWLAEDPTHRWAFQELSEVWARLRTLNDVGEMKKDGKVVPFPGDTLVSPAAAGSAPAPAARRDWSPLAAVVVIALAVMVNFFTGAQEQRWLTGTGETGIVHLDDGSRVELNARTRMTARLDDRYRSIELLGGEAIFEVAPDTRPFVVRTRHGEVVALGTVFAVDAREDRFEVSVIEGRVAVSASARNIALTEADVSTETLPGTSSATLGAGQHARIAADAVMTASDMPQVAIERELAWRHGYVHFDDAPLAGVLEDIQRYTDLSIHLGSEELGALRINGIFLTHDVDAFLAHLSREYGVVAHHGGRGWVVLRAPHHRKQKNPPPE